jgi:hypothetical protein
MAPQFLMWCIWREQNARSFEDCESSVLELKYFMFKCLYNSPYFSSFTEFLDLLSYFSP